MRNVQIIGVVGNDAELKTIGDKQFVKFSVATKNFKEDNSTWVSVMFHRVGIKGFLTKGTKVFVNGPLKIATKDGKVFLDTFADTVEMLGGGERKPDASADADSSDYP